MIIEPTLQEVALLQEAMLLPVATAGPKIPIHDTETVSTLDQEPLPETTQNMVIAPA